LKLGRSEKNDTSGKKKGAKALLSNISQGKKEHDPDSKRETNAAFTKITGAEKSKKEIRPLNKLS